MNKIFPFHFRTNRWTKSIYIYLKFLSSETIATHGVGNQCSLLFLLALLACTVSFDTAAQLKSGATSKDTPFVTPLRSRGFSLLPSPQQVDLGKQNVIVNGTWSVVSEAGNDHIAYKRLMQGAEELHSLKFSAKGGNKITLKVQPNTVKGTSDPALNEQGYLLKITSAGVEITGNGNAGLFYGVQSLLQLLRLDVGGGFIIPECEIRDWPSLQLRFVHWDTKHHQKRIETLKRLIDWHAYFKVNMISFEMEDKYEYPTHPVIGAPGAYTKKEMQDLTRYALERHIQIVPNIQAPAHMTYVLKHKEFAHLKSDHSNYQMCMCDPEYIEVIFDMYQDMIDATPGVDYFHASTDEVYYAGICDKCKAPYNEENRSLAWVEFATKAHDWLAKRGRKMIAWVEYPLLPKHISLLPPDIINGIGGNEEFTIEENKSGMRQLAYSSTQGAELLFPNHFSTEYRGRTIEGRLEGNSRTVAEGLSAGAKPIGTFAATWDDAGLHEETFHLGWATVTQYGWKPYGPTVEQTVADFMDVFYGSGAEEMLSIYKLSIEGARFFESGWDNVKSTERETAYGNSHGKGVGGERTDELLSMPEIPSAKTLEIKSAFSSKYADLIAEAETMKEKNEALVHKINLAFRQVQRNHYNLEVFLSLAYLERHFIETILTMRDVEKLMERAHEAATKERPSDAVANLTAASNKVGELINSGKWMWENLTKTWEKSRYEKNRSVGGRDFYHEMDDVKDHFADRRKGLDYMMAPFERMGISGWRSKLNERINKYASEHKVPITGLKEQRLED
jgi:hexosaminidase